MNSPVARQIIEIKLSDVKFDEDIYPRKDHDVKLVQKYADCLEEIEAAENFISLAHGKKLVDGKHRYLAYLTVYVDNPHRVIKVYYYNVVEPLQQFKLAIKLNSSHGAQLSVDDKRADAVELYRKGAKYDEIKEVLSVGKTTLTKWLSTAVKAEKERIENIIFDMWLNCKTHEEIAAKVGLERSTISKTVDNLVNSVLEDQDHRLMAEYKLAFDGDGAFVPPLYNVWTKAAKSKEQTDYFGNSEQTFVDWLVYLYTQPFDGVVDLFAGGGATIDICKKRLRRYFVSDRLPMVARGDTITKWDINDGLPPSIGSVIETPVLDDEGKPTVDEEGNPIVTKTWPITVPWKDIGLVYLDPPYWRQAQGQYSDDPEDLANMPLDEFNKKLYGLINAMAEKLPLEAKIALIIQPTQWKADNKEFVDHVMDACKAVKLPVLTRISVPYSTQQYNAQMVNYAKEHKMLLVITREIIVWEKR